MMAFPIKGKENRLHYSGRCSGLLYLQIAGGNIGGWGGGGGGGQTRNLVISHITLSSPPGRRFVT